MNLLDRQLSRSILGSCAAAVCLFGFVLMAGNVIRELLGPLLAGQLQLLAFGRLLLLMVPVVASYALPLGMLTAVLLTLGRMSSDGEITAMRAAGLSVPRIAMPIFMLAAAGVALGLRVNFESMPRAKLQYESELASALRSNPLSFIVPKTFIRNFPGYVIYVGSRQGPDIRDVWVWQLDDQKRVIRFIRAESGRIDYNEEANEFVIPLYHDQEEEYDRRQPDDFLDSSPKSDSFEETASPVHLSLARYFSAIKVHQKLQWMTYPELLAERSRVERIPAPGGGEAQRRRDLMKVSLTIQDKVNWALAVFSFALIGVPLGIRVSRRETSANLGVAVILTLSYYFVTVTIGWLDGQPALRPDLLLWIPNLVFLFLGVGLLRRLDRA